MQYQQSLIDVSHTIRHGMITYPGLPGPSIGDFLTREASRASYAPGTEFQIGRMELVANTGTYVDAPFHRFPRGKDLADLPLASLANLPGIVIRTLNRGSRAIDRSWFADHPVAGRAVLVHTGWSQHWGTEAYLQGHPFLTEDAVQFLVGAGAALVGIDSLNIDDTADGRRPAHTLLLQNEIPVVEHLTRLAALPDEGFRFFAVPVKVRGMGSFPVRAFGLVG